MKRPPYIVSSRDVPEQEGAYPAPFDRERLSFSRELGTAAGSVKVGLNLERLPPGRRTSFTHAHSSEEEIVYVLSGSCLVRIVEPGGEAAEHPVAAGDVVAFPAGTGIAHTFVNRGSEECLLLCWGERRPDVDKVSYPDDPEYDRQLRENRPARYWKREG